MRVREKCNISRASYPRLIIKRCSDLLEPSGSQRSWLTYQSVVYWQTFFKKNIYILIYLFGSAHEIFYLAHTIRKK